MSEVPFIKVQSLGNDFVLLLGPELPEGLNLEHAARTLCKRHLSVGADGLLVLDRIPGGLSLQMFNPDGTEDFCGNGLRCAALVGADLGWFEQQAAVEHHGQKVLVRMSEGGLIETETAPGSFDPALVPSTADAELFEHEIEVSGERLTISALSTGSTHTVIFSDRLPKSPRFERIGSILEHHSLFPMRTSVVFAQPESPDRLRIRIWERGVGETLGCGTGSSAAAVVWARRRDEGGCCQIANPGGEAVVKLLRWDAPISTAASASEIFRGKVALQSPATTT